MTNTLYIPNILCYVASLHLYAWQSIRYFPLPCDACLQVSVCATMCVWVYHEILRNIHLSLLKHLMYYVLLFLLPSLEWTGCENIKNVKSYCGNPCKFSSILHLRVAAFKQAIWINPIISTVYKTKETYFLQQSIYIIVN